MSYFKVTKPNGESFHTPEVVYAEGKRVRPLPHDGRRKLCGPGVLHASPTAPEAARYGQWPYKLWQVEGKPFLEDADKAGFKQLTVTRELDVAECFGPNGARVLSLVRRAEQLTADEAERLAAAGDAARSAAWDAARAAASYAARSAARDAASYAARSAARYAARAAARAAARDAAWALVVEDLIGRHGFTQDHFDTLTGPWREVIGEPFECLED